MNPSPACFMRIVKQPNLSQVFPLMPTGSLLTKGLRSCSNGSIRRCRLDQTTACGPAPGPLEDYTARFDGLFATLAQRRALRRYLEGLLLSAEHNKTLTALANTEPVVGAQHRKEAQRLQWFLA